MSTAEFESGGDPNSTRPLVLFPKTRKFFKTIQSEGEVFLWNVGMLVKYSKDIAGFVIKGKVKPKQVIEQAAFVGIDNLGVAMILTVFSGMVISLQVAQEMVNQGAGNYVGALVALSMLRELAPIMTGFAVIAMAGSAFAAELSTMKITQQVDALRVLHVHPIRYLVVPRVLACTAMLPLMTIITAIAGILGGLWVATSLTDLHPGAYLDSVWHQTELRDIASTLGKSAVFGYIIAMLSTVIGINTSGGAREVGLSTTRAVVWCFIMMAISDYILTYVIYGSR